MLADVQRDALDARVGGGQATNAAPLPAQILPLRLRQAAGGLPEPEVDIFFVHLLLDKAPLIDQGDNRAILHAVPDGVLVNQPAEPGHGVLFAFHQRRAGEADVAGVGEYAAHPGRHEAVVGAVAFVHEHEDVAGGVFDLLPLDGVELVDDTGDDVRPGAVYQLHQMASARRSGGG